MQAGKLRHRVNIEAKTPTQDEWGEPLDIWTPVFENVPARIETLGGREYWAAQQINSEINAKLTIWWRAGVESDMRITHQSPEQAALSPAEFDIYDIVSLIPDSATGRRELVIYATKRNGESFRSGGMTP